MFAFLSGLPTSYSFVCHELDGLINLINFYCCQISQYLTQRFVPYTKVLLNPPTYKGVRFIILATNFSNATRLSYVWLPGTYNFYLRIHAILHGTPPLGSAYKYIRGVRIPQRDSLEATRKIYQRYTWAQCSHTPAQIRGQVQNRSVPTSICQPRRWYHVTRLPCASLVVIRWLRLDPLPLTSMVDKNANLLRFLLPPLTLRLQILQKTLGCFPK